MTYCCTYCEYYGDTFTGNYAQVAAHQLEHPINCEPERI